MKMKCHIRFQLLAIIIFLIGLPSISGASELQEYRSPGEFEPVRAFLMSWDYEKEQAAIVAATPKDVKIYINVSSESARKNALAYLQKTVSDLSNVEFMICPYDSVWMRDYGPHFLIGKNGRYMIHDTEYYPSRPNDNKFPQILGKSWSYPVNSSGLRLEGGNYMTDGKGTGFMTREIYEDNSRMTPAEIEKRFMDAFHLKRIITLEYIKNESTHHIDMFAKFISPTDVLVGKYAEGDINYDILERNAAKLASLRNLDGEPYRVIRIPMPPPVKFNKSLIPPGKKPAWSEEELRDVEKWGVNRTYTNSLIVNRTVLMPVYNIPLDKEAADVYRKALPGYDVIGIDSSRIIHSGGAVHCITMQYPAN